MFFEKKKKYNLDRINIELKKEVNRSAKLVTFDTSSRHIDEIRDAVDNF